MFGADFTFSTLAWVDVIIKVGIIIIGAVLVILFVRKLLAKVVTMHIPKVREETPDQLAYRSKTLSHVAARFLSVVIGVVAFMMVLSVVGLDITPLLASLGVGALALGAWSGRLARED